MRNYDVTLDIGVEGDVLTRAVVARTAERVGPVPTPIPVPTPVPTPPPSVILPPPSAIFVPVQPSVEWSMKTLQGRGARSWPDTVLDDEFGRQAVGQEAAYIAFINRLGGFSTANLSMAGWGYAGMFPHPKPFAGSYSPVCSELSIAGRSAVQVAVDLKARGPSNELNLYTTPLLDCVAKPWNPLTGVPSAGDQWDPGGYENLRNSLNSMLRFGSAWGGVFLDLCAGPFITGANLRKAVKIIMEDYRRRVFINANYADLINFQFVLNSVPELDHTSTIYCEGIYKDGSNGYRDEASKRIGAYMASTASNPRRVRWAGTIEADGIETVASMQDYQTPSQAYTDWLTGFYGCFQPYRYAGARCEHNRERFDYCGTDNGA